MLSERPDLPKTYDPAEVEPRRYAEWLRAGVFHEEPDPARPPFIISMPPPNITGRAHIGHGSTYTPMDVLTRYHRMLGENADWIPGQDHAAIATEAVMVRELAKEGTTREALGREAFVARVWRWREEYGGIIDEQFRVLGFGPDWPRERFTMDPGLSAAVTRVFLDLYRDGLIYRGTRLVNWDVKAQSTVSDAEVDNVEVDTFLWRLRYAAEDGGAGVDIATTRPETFLADVAVAVHPADERYRALVGKRVVLPLIGRTIPVLADEAVDSAFGTGVVKVTPAHDATDYDISRRHALEMPTVIDFDGRIIAPAWRIEPDAAARRRYAATAGAMGPYIGMDRIAARERIVADLNEAGALVRTEPYHTTVPVSDRSGEVIEPLLSLQWFCRMDTLAPPALEAYRSGAVRFVPERFGRTYEQWLENIRDWNISRQVWWGHRLPVWYTPDDAVIVAASEEEAHAIAREQHGGVPLRRDPDTLDTWFSSGLWPFSILGWPEQTPELAHWYPNQVMITGREIIFLWVARMVMLGLRFVGRIPFRDVFITPLVFDIAGRKMSKSLGNVIDPLEMAQKYGADGFRLGTMMQMRLESQELRFDERVCDEARRFNTKLWNALRYTRALPEGLPTASKLPPPEMLTIADKWILTELRRCVAAVTAALDTYQMGPAAQTLHDFGWYRFCDWYLESTKADSQRGTRAAVLSFVFNAFVRALHPIEPFVTEEIWQTLPHDGATIVTASWPDAGELPEFPAEAAVYEAFIASVERIRNARSELGLKPSEPVVLASAPLPESIAEQYAVLVRGELHTNGSADADLPLADRLARVSVKADPRILRERYARDARRLDAEIERGEKKLANAAFTAKAKPEVVAQEREKLATYRGERDRVQTALTQLDAGAG
ncbi:MAG: valine--tRNA ligase [Candidatus Velthaea sp.]